MKYLLIVFLGCILVFVENFLMSEIKEVKVSFRIQPYESKYQHEVVSLIEKIQVCEFNIPIEEGQRKELQAINKPSLDYFGR